MERENTSAHLTPLIFSGRTGGRGNADQQRFSISGLPTEHWINHKNLNQAELYFTSTTFPVPYTVVLPLSARLSVWWSTSSSTQGLQEEVFFPFPSEITEKGTTLVQLRGKAALNMMTLSGITHENLILPDTCTFQNHAQLYCNPLGLDI